MTRHQSTIQIAYEESISSMDTSELDSERKKAERYNAALIPGVTAFSRDALIAAAEEYREILIIGGSEIMGYVEIPKIKVHLPIFHGTGEDSLQRGIGHLLGTSLPIGGKGSHSVLTGHSGVSGQKLFSDICLLEPGDQFHLHVLGETLTYEVEAVYTVLPEDTDKLIIEPDKDLCTLVTCTPYGINTHRLLVRGHRVDSTTAEEATSEDTSEIQEPVRSKWTAQYMKGVYIGLGVMVGTLVISRAISLKSKKKYSVKHRRNQP